MNQTNYDLAFAIGQTCGCSQSLRRAGLQHLSFPGDWTAPLFGDEASPTPEHDLLNRVDILCDGCADFFRADDFMFQRTILSTGKDVYVNRRTRYIFNHDFPAGCDFSGELPRVAEKYRRRKERLVGLIHAAKRVLAVRMDMPGGPNPTSLDDCRHARRRLSERFAPAKIDFLLISHDPARPFARRTFEEVEEGFFRISFDYLDRNRTDLPHQPDLSLTGAALAEHFTVSDYRTDEEKRRYEEQSHSKKIAKRKDRLQRRLGKLSAWLHGRLNPIDGLLARRHRRTFAQIAILGFNCDPAFRFYRRWGFLDSSLFAWANSIDLTTLAAAIRNLDRLGTGAFTFHAPSRMWRCEESRVYFHGRMKAALPGCPAPTDAELVEDREELRSRLAHLREKFVRYATNGTPTLFVYRLGDEAALPGLAGKIAALERALDGLGARNRTLLLVCRREDLHLMPPGPNRVFRAVGKFNPPDKVTNPRKGDTAGWNRIFTEFAPAVVLPKRHKFKFE